MIKLFEMIDSLHTRLYSAKCIDHSLGDFRVVLGLYNNVVAYLKDFKEQGGYKELEKNFPLVTFVNTDNTDIYDIYFKEKRHVHIEDSRIRFSNLLDIAPSYPDNKVPVVTFYSYKGGVGRSTTLASFASHLAINRSMKVVVMDCDFEAPGMQNFFLEDPDNIIYKNGLVEYFIDSELKPDIPLSNYYIEASKKFSGKGSIYVFQAGNLSSDESRGHQFSTDLIHYLNGLTRLDIFSKNTLTEKFNILFGEVQEKLKPDIILLDSRTGFNDVFGVTAFRLSNVVLGFFGSDAQTRPGIDFFLESLLRKRAPRLLIAHSIIPPAQKTRLHKNFCEYIDDRMQEITDRKPYYNNNGSLHIDAYPISENDVLRYVGKPTESYEEFINMIERQEFSDYRNLFEKLFDLCMDSNAIKKLSPADIIKREHSLQKIVLKNTQDNMPAPYAENVKDFSEELDKNHYFFRLCMEDLFNAGKFLILGAKGTGKSYIYQSLGNERVVDALRKRANKEDYDYLFVPVINNEHYFDTIKLNFVKDIDFDLFYERFWIVYIWNVVMKNKPFGYQTKLQTFVITDSTETADSFYSYIMDGNYIKSIEKDLYDLDSYLLNTKQSSNVVVLFDELDNIVKPILWSQRISPLINLCKKMNFSNIHPKVFLRSDLFDKIQNINNKNDLKNRTIGIEWSREELFSFFFKIVLSHSKEEFFELMKLYSYNKDDEINAVIASLNDEDGQPPLDEKVLSTLASAFFGKYASEDNNTNYGLSYDWFFNNLKNANETLNIRPFIDLLAMAIKKALKQGPHSPMPVLPSTFYTNSDVRSNAVKRHIEDLSSEAGNTDLSTVLGFIREKATVKYKKDGLRMELFDELLDQIIADGNLTETKDRESITTMLLVNGVIRIRFVKENSGRLIRGYQFALLYKYYLGLRTRMKK